MVIEVRTAVTFENYLLKEMRGSLWGARDILYLYLSGCMLKMGPLKYILILKREREKM